MRAVQCPWVLLARKCAHSIRWVDEKVEKSLTICELHLLTPVAVSARNNFYNFSFLKDKTITTQNCLIHKITMGSQKFLQN